MSSLATLLAIGWEPEIRGISSSSSASVVLCGSVYLILATNLGSRLGFLVALAALFGWLMLMGIIWWVYGIGLKGTTRPGSARRSSGPSSASSAIDVAQVDDISTATTDEPVDGWIAHRRGRPGVRPGGGRGRRHPPEPDRDVHRPASTSRSPSTRRAASGTRRSATAFDFFAFLHRPALRHRPGPAGRPDLTEPGRGPAAGRRRPVEAADVRADGARPRHPSPARRLADDRLRAAVRPVLLHAAPARAQPAANLAEAASGGAVVPVGAAD